MFKVLRNGLLRYIPYTCPNRWCNPCSKCYAVDCFGAWLIHVQTCDVTRVQSATQFGIHTLHCFFFNGCGAPMCCEERVQQRFYTSCRTCFETVPMTRKKAKTQKHCKTLDKIAKIQKNVRPSGAPDHVVPIGKGRFWWLCQFTGYIHVRIYIRIFNYKHVSVSIFMLYALEVLLDVLLDDPCKGLPTTRGGKDSFWEFLGT